MKNITVRSGDTISKLVLREFVPSNRAEDIEPQLFDCLIRYIAVINGKNLNLYDNISQNVIEDPDSLKPGQILVFPETLVEGLNDPRFKEINEGACGRLGQQQSETLAPKMKLWPVYAGLGLLALLLLTRKKKRR
jgi:hypothetical protein